MSISRTATRTAAVLGATTALTLAGAGAASATTHESAVDGNSVSVTFTLDGGVVDGDVCGAFLAPTATAAALASTLTSGNISEALKALVGNEDVTVLREDGFLTSTPFTTLGSVGGTGKTSGTVGAEDVPSNVYALVSYCGTDENPSINPLLLVGNPLEAVMGSVEMGSSNGGLDTASALLGNGGLDTASALLGGEGDDSSSLGNLMGGALGDAEA